MAEFKDLPENTNPVDDDLLAVAQDSDDVTVKVKLSNLPIVGQLASTANGQGASRIGIEDSAGNFAALTVEDALAELYAMLDGLDSWVSGTTYTAGEDVVILDSNNKIYRCIVTNSDVTFTPSNWQAVGKDSYTIANDAVSGSNQTLTAPTTDLIRLTNGSLVSIDMIPAGEIGNPIWLINDTGVDVIISNETGATAANRIKTGTGGALKLKDQSSIQVIYDTTDSRWQIVGGTGSESSGGGLDTFHTENFESTVAADWSTGNSSTFLTVGSGLVGILSDETTSPIAGDSSIKYVSAAVSINDWFASPTYDLDLKQRGNDVGITFYFTLPTDANYEVVFWDVTNSEKLNSALDIIEESSGRTRYSASVFIPDSCTQYKYGFHSIVENGAGHTLIVDDFELSTNPFVYKNLIQNGARVIGSGNGGASIVANTTNIDWIEVTDTDGAWNGTEFIAPRSANYIITGSAGATSSVARDMFLYVDGSNVRRIHRGQTAELIHDFEFQVYLEAGEIMSIRSDTTYTANNNNGHHIAIQEIPSSSEHIVTAAQSNTTNWIPYTPVTQGFGTPTLAEYFYKIVGDSVCLLANFDTGTVTASEAQLGLPSIGGQQLTVSDSVTIPTVKGSAHRNTGTTTDIRVIVTGGDSFINFSQDNVGYKTAQNGSTIWGSIESTTIETGLIPVNELDSDAKFLAAVPVQKVAYIKDVKTSGTHGGTFASGSWQTRDLNTLEGDTSLVSLSANQFTLNKGDYLIEWFAPANNVDRHQSRLRNITDSVSFTGSNESISGNLTKSNGFANVTITTPKDFEIQHQCVTTGVTTGFGGEINSGFSVDFEVYTQVKITKLR